MILSAVGFLTANALLSFDYESPRVNWLNWSVGYEYHEDPVAPYHEYFIGNMLDGDPKTAWMVGGRYRYVDRGSYADLVADPRGDYVPNLFINFPKTMMVDGIRIMPGYNKSPEIFARNNRITKIAFRDAKWSEYFDKDEPPIATATFKDEMGWQTATFAPRELDGIKIEINDWVKGKDNDFCISEIQLLSGGKPVAWQLTPLLLSTAGSECGCGTTWHIVDRTGKAIREAGTNEFDTYASDPSGRYVFSNALTKNFFQFYVLDMATGKFIAHADRPRNKGWWVSNTQVEWKKGTAIAKVSWDEEGKAAKEETITLKWSP